MQGREFPPTSWLPWAAFACGAGGAMALRSESSLPLGIGLLVLGADLLWMWHRRMRGVFAPILALKDRGATDLDDLPRLWADLERENLELRERARREDLLRRSILASLDVGIILLGPRRQILMFNPAAQRLLGSSSHVFLKGTATGVLRDPESLGHLDRAYGGQSQTWDRERSGRNLRLWAHPMPVPTEEATDEWGVLLSFEDVTQQEALEQTRRKFISNASHELKTPVTGIKIAAENLQDGGWLPPEAETHLRIIHRNVDRMTMLIQDISELSRIETGALTLEPMPLETGGYLEEILEGLGPYARSRDIRMELDLESGLGERKFMADPLRLQQLLDNLLSNAVKFSPVGGIVKLQARLQGQWLCLSVSDQGPGIAPEDAPRIFERFYRTKSARSVPGTGLGLAIVKHLARVMGGEVDFTSSPGQGSTFRVRLPWESAR